MDKNALLFAWQTARLGQDEINSATFPAGSIEALLSKYFEEVQPDGEFNKNDARVFAIIKKRLGKCCF